MARLFTTHSRGLAATFSDVENHALAQSESAATTPGSVLVRTNAGGFRYYALQQYDHDGKRRESYLAGPVGSPEAERAAADARRTIAERRDLLASLRLLVREGYGFLEPKHYAAIAALANHGFFAGGGILVGTHAFEVVLNRLGIRAASFATTDVDIARAGRIVMPSLPENGLLGILRTSGIDFQEVPGFDPRDPAIKFKERGRSRFTVDLLVATQEMEASTLPVPELKAHAGALPYFKYLISETQTGAAIARAGCVAVRVPLPEKLAIHKLLVAQLRRGKSEKGRKDVNQAAILMAALAELHPGAVREAYTKAPVSARTRIRKSMQEALAMSSDHPRACSELEEILTQT
jgi:hypothetical protein